MCGPGSSTTCDPATAPSMCSAIGSMSKIMWHARKIDDVAAGSRHNGAGDARPDRLAVAQRWKAPANAPRRPFAAECVSVRALESYLQEEHPRAEHGSVRP